MAKGESPQTPINSPFFSIINSEGKHLDFDEQYQSDFSEVDSNKIEENNSRNKNIINTIQSKSNSNSKTRENTKNTKDKFTCKKRKPTGRISNKNKEKGVKGKKNEYHKDNLIYKAKTTSFEAIRKCINKKIKKCMKGYCEIKKINSYQVKNGNVSFNIELMDKKIRNIFSVKISNIYKSKINSNSNYNYDYNKDFIDYIYKNKNKYPLLINIFEKTFLQCLNICRDLKYNENLTEENSCEIKEMEDLKIIFEEEINNKLKCKDDKYKEKLLYTIDNFKNIFLEKERNVKLKKKKDEKVEIFAKII